MGKPIAGRDQYPFQINGIIVDGAKINGVTFVKDLYIYKQRSYNYYDLIDSAGNVYEFIEIVWRNEDTTLLNYFDNSSFIVNNIKDNSFFIKIQDVPRDIYGFITLIQSNKVKVSTGDYIFFNQNDDYALLSVRCIPATIQASKNQLIDIGVSFLPANYPNQEGYWESYSDLIAEVGRSLTSSASFKCLEVGHANVTFNPHANSALAATAHIFITEEVPSYTSFVVMQNNPTGASLSNDDTYFPGDEFVISAIFNPLSYVPTEDLEVIYDDTVLEYLGSDDHLNYKFKVLEDTTFTSVRTRVEFRDGDMFAFDQPVIRQLSDSVYIGFEGSRYCRPGNSYQYKFAYYNKPKNPSVSWAVQTPSIGTIDQTGLFTCTSAGEQKIYLNANGGVNKNYNYAYCSPYVPDMYKYFPNDRSTFFVGEQIQLTAQTVPSTVPLVGTWRNRHSSDSEYFTVSSSGLLTILKAPENPENSVFYVGFSYSGASGVGGTLMDTVESLEKTFVILPQVVDKPVTGIRMYDYSARRYIPLGGKTSTYVTVSPWGATENKDWTVEMSVPGIVELDYDPYFNNNYISTDIIVNGIAKGQTEVTFTCVSNPDIKATYTFTVF